MASIEDGDYWIHNAYNDGSLVMDITGNDMKNGANVQVYSANLTDAQVFTVTTRSDGSRQITSRFTGKSIDVTNGQFYNGQNVQMYTDNDTRAQRWEIVDAGSTITYGGTTYELFQIRQYDTEDWCVELLGNSGFTPGTNVCISQGTAADQKWFFVPIPLFQDGGLYELALYLDTRYALDVHSGSAANGANVILTGRHNANDHKWVLTEHDTDKWLLRNIASGKYAEVKNGTAADLTNVDQWDFNSSDPNRWLWNPSSHGTATVDGKTVAVIKLYSWVDGGGETYIMDANQHVTLDLGNICIVHTDTDATGQYSQMWALIPTTATDPNMAVPSRMGWSKYVGDSTYNATRAATDTLYPTWECTDTWATSGPNHYQWRYRSRVMSASKSTWGAWSDFTAWSTALVTRDGKRCWVTEGLPASLTSSQKALQYEMQVRTVGVDETERVVGNAASQNLVSAWEPAVTISNAGFSPEGLRFDYASDYDAGTNVITVTKITDASGNNILPESVRFDGLDESSSVLVPISSLSDWVDDGDTLTVTWHNGTDQYPEFDTDHTASLVVAYDTGHGTSLSPTVTASEGRTLALTMPDEYATQSVWFRTDGALVEVEPVDGVYYIEYPFGIEFDVFAAGTSEDGDTWATWHQSYDGTVEGMRPCHAWNWEGGSFVLEYEINDYLGSSFSVESVHDTMTLNSRKWQVAHASGSYEGSITANGILRAELTESTKEDLIALGEVGHVRYRSPFGDMADVFVKGYSWEENFLYAKVSVKMVRETR